MTIAKILLVVESPAKCKTISKILGPNYIVRATHGHIIDLPAGKGCGLGVDVHNEFEPKYEVIFDKKDKIKAIYDSAIMVDEIILASDPDREGEIISYHVYNQLLSLNKPMKRVTFSEITESSIKAALKKPRDIDLHMVKSQQARRVIDRIVGFMVSPYLSRVLGDSLSAGRCQSVALRMIVDREIEIENFVPETYFNIHANLALNNTSEKIEAKLSKKVTSDEEAEKIKISLLSGTFSISNIESDVRYTNPPACLTTAKLQQEASAKFKFAADRTMKAAQSLYEAGAVSYIRTDSTRNSPESIEAVRKYIKEQNYLIPDSPNVFKNKDAAQDAHEAIRPTNVDMHPSKFIAQDEDQKKVYNLIWTMFVASQMTPSISDTVQITIKTSDNYELKADGKILREAGWLKVAEDYVKKTKDIILPVMNKGDKLILVSPKVVVEKKKTQPSSRYNDGTIIKELEKKEIGRPSTYATIISKLSNRKYVIKTIKGFQPTELGRKVVEQLIQFFSFMDYKYTANMENKLDDIASGKSQYINALNDFFEGFKIEFQKARGSEGKRLDFPCPICKDEMVLRKSKYGFFAGCIKYPACKGIINVVVNDNKVYRKEDGYKNIQENVKCPECSSSMELRTDGNFGPYYVCGTYPKCYGKRKVPYGKKCSDCGNELYANLMNGILKLACMGYPDCKHVEELPQDGPEVNWVNPVDVTPPHFSLKVEKVLKNKKIVNTDSSK